MSDLVGYRACVVALPGLDPLHIFGEVVRAALGVVKLETLEGVEADVRAVARAAEARGWDRIAADAQRAVTLISVLQAQLDESWIRDLRREAGSGARQSIDEIRTLIPWMVGRADSIRRSAEAITTGRAQREAAIRDIARELGRYRRAGAAIDVHLAQFSSVGFAALERSNPSLAAALRAGTLPRGLGLS